jgi:hypothetical protein
MAAFSASLLRVNTVERQNPGLRSGAVGACSGYRITSHEKQATFIRRTRLYFRSQDDSAHDSYKMALVRAEKASDCERAYSGVQSLHGR